MTEEAPVMEEGLATEEPVVSEASAIEASEASAIEASEVSAADEVSAAYEVGATHHVAATHHMSASHRRSSAKMAAPSAKVTAATPHASTCGGVGRDRDAAQGQSGREGN